jgi:hypothetical protein
MTSWYAYSVLILAGFLPNEIWRVLGLWLGAGLREDSEILYWVRAVAGATLAGVIAQLLFAPPGMLADVAPTLRFGSVVFGLAVFWLTRRSIFFGTIAAEIALIGGKYLMG